MGVLTEILKVLVGGLVSANKDIKRSYNSALDHASEQGYDRDQIKAKREEINSQCEKTGKALSEFQDKLNNY